MRMAVQASDHDLSEIKRMIARVLSDGRHGTNTSFMRRLEQTILRFDLEVIAKKKSWGKRRRVKHFMVCAAGPF
jgi:hypothetical protein